MKLEIEHLTAGYETGIVLSDLSLSLRQGEFLSLLGPSGCGKTTLMKAIAGIIPVQSGRIRLDGQDITGLPIHKRGTVIVFQDMRLFPHKTVAENVAFPLKMQGVPKAERMKTALELLQKVRMGSYANRKPEELSGGQQQRIALARALAARPKLLLLDEPFSALDENLREEMRGLVLELRREFDMTVILVTHDRGEALSMSDRVALLFDGRLIQCDTPETVYTRPATRQAADYFGDCVYLPGTVSDGSFRSALLDLPVQEPDGCYDLVIRPSQVEDDPNGSLEAEVLEIRYYGGAVAVELELAAGIRLRKTYSRHPGWKVGQRIRCTLCADHAVLFPRT